MATYLMFGKYSSESAKKISAKRTAEARTLVKKHGGKIEAIYALLGDPDLVLIVSLPGNEQAMKASVELSKATGISFATAPAVSVEQFDVIIGKA
jgi:uncharacterized protein with GYD domain